VVRVVSSISRAGWLNPENENRISERKTGKIDESDGPKRPKRMWNWLRRTRGKYNLANEVIVTAMGEERL